MNQKGFAPILLILLIASAVGGYLLYQKQIKIIYKYLTAVQLISLIPAQIRMRLPLIVFPVILIQILKK